MRKDRQGWRARFDSVQEVDGGPQAVALTLLASAATGEGYTRAKMPNGGSDCCGTCWFNRANGGKAGSRNHDRSIPSYCEIRNLTIENPFYTYCGNHPYRRQERVPTPLGPVYVHAGDSGRQIWVSAPDTEEVRRRLLDHLENLTELRDGYPFFGRPLAREIVDECERLGEERAIPILERIAEELRRSGQPWDGFRDAIERIRRAVDNP